MKARLRLLYFLQFGVWGCYLTTLGQFLGAGGLGSRIAWFYAAIGLVSLITPALLGYIADRYVRPAVLLAVCHAMAGVTMICAFVYATLHPVLDFAVFYTLYLLFLAFYMPTMALANTVTFGLLSSRGQKPVDAFPAIRVWGTVGFVAAMWWVNSTYWHDGAPGWTLSDTHPFAGLRFQYNAGQLCCSGVMALLTAAYVFTLPRLAVQRSAEAETHVAPRGGRFSALRVLFRIPSLRTFLIFAVFSGVCLQISNGYATPFITHFMGDPQYAGSFAAGNATMLFSLSQIAEAAFILMVGVAMNRIGMRGVFAIGLAAWSLRFLLLGLGNPDEGLWMLILSMVAYGVAFNFITIAGHLYVDRLSPSHLKGFGQGAMMLMSNGLGATAGTLCAGAVINHWCHWEPVSTPGGTLSLFMGNWTLPWVIFAAYAAILAIAWIASKRRA